MTIFLSEDPRLGFLERQMQQPPGYRRKGGGIHISDQMEWKAYGSYEKVMDAVIGRMQMNSLKKRLDRAFPGGEQQIFFKGRKHREDYEALTGGNWQSMAGRNQQGSPAHTGRYAGAVFLLTAEEGLWKKISENILDTGIYFDRMRIGRVTLEQYILFHMARDIYNGTRHVRLSELADRELIPDSVFRLIVNAFVISQCGTEVMEWRGNDAGND